MRLAPHFDSREFASSDGERMPAAYLRELRRLCTLYLEPLRREFGVTTVHSGHRSDALNLRVGGAPRSFHRAIAHRKGAAADVTCRRGGPPDWYRFLDDLGAPGLGLYGSHVHVDTGPAGRRWTG